MMRKLLLIVFLVLTGAIFAQEHPHLAFAEKMPEFPGGDSAFQTFLKNNIQYPDSALKYGREGTVYVYFEVAKDGSCGNFSVKKGVSGAPELSVEALRVMALMPKWSPGVMNGRRVKVGMTVPIKFSLH